MKRYVGLRNGHGCTVRVTDSGSIRPLPLRLDLVSHSPTGFEWGYGGSGPAQLALAILADHLLDDRRATRLYQEFQEDVVAHLPAAAWDIGAHAIEEWLSSGIAPPTCRRR